MSDTDRIEKSVYLKAPIARVWRALTQAAEFGQWFRVDLEGEFVVGAQVEGQVTYPGYEHVRFVVVVERMETERLFSFTWNAEDEVPENTPTCTILVEFHLEESDGGTHLKVIESGFDQLPPDRRMTVFHRNEEGWTIQMENIRRYVTA